MNRIDTLNFGGIDAGITGSQSSMSSLTSSLMSSTEGSGSSWCHSLLSRTFTGTTGHQDLAPEGQAMRKKSHSISVEHSSNLLPFSFSSRRGSLQPEMTANNSGGFFSSSFTSFGGSGGNNGSTQTGFQNNNSSNSNVEKECKQVFFDCAL